MQTSKIAASIRSCRKGATYEVMDCLQHNNHNEFCGVVDQVDLSHKICR